MTALILLSDFLETQIEIWRPIQGLPQGYDVSNLGHIRSRRERYSLGYHGFRWRLKDDPHEVTPKPDKDGYLRLFFGGKYVKRLGYTPFIHQIVARAFVNGFVPGREVNHLNLVKTDNRSDNLEWLSKDANRFHAVRHGAHAKGERIHCAKLTVESVKQIRTLRLSGVGTQELCRRFGVDRSCIKRVLNRRTWKHVP